MTLENVLPKNPDPEWRKVFDNEGAAEDCNGLIGNMALLSAADNKNTGRLNFNEKKEIYSKSPLETTKQIARYDKWDRDSILSRGEGLGKQAAEIWRIPFD